jgi:hypothetical protein
MLSALIKWLKYPVSVMGGVIAVAGAFDHRANHTHQSTTDGLRSRPIRPNLGVDGKLLKHLDQAVLLFSSEE